MYHYCRVVYYYNSSEWLFVIYLYTPLEVKKERKEGLGRAIPCVVTEAWFCKTIPIKDPKTKLSLLLIVRNPVVKFPNLEWMDISKSLVIALCVEISPQNPADELIH